MQLLLEHMMKNLNIERITIAGISYLTRLVPWIAATPGASLGAAMTGIWLLTWVNTRGLRAAGSVQLVTSVIKLLPFVAVIGLAIWRLAATRGAVLPPVTSESFTFAGATGAVGLTLYAMLGLESATVPADAVEDPARVIPLATMVGTGLSAVVSIIATCAVVLMLPAASVMASKAPISDFIAVSWGHVAGGFVAVCAVISCFGCLNGFLLIGGELPVAMADAGTLPRPHLTMRVGAVRRSGRRRVGRATPGCVSRAAPGSLHVPASRSRRASPVRRLR